MHQDNGSPAKPPSNGLEVDPSRYTSKTLEELREEQNGWQFAAPPITPISPEYAASMAPKPNTFDSVSDRLIGLTSRPQSVRPPLVLDGLPITEKDAKALVLWTANALSRLGKFEVDDHNREVLHGLTKYFAGLDGGPYDPARGIMLCGSAGVGKTLLMRIFQTFAAAAQYAPTQFRIAHVLDVYDAIARKGLEAMATYTEDAVCFDDFGQEPEVYRSFGNAVGVMETVLTARYNRFQRGQLITHITTNLSIEEIGEKYGDRILDRCWEMFNIIPLTGESKRK